MNRRREQGPGNGALLTSLGLRTENLFDASGLWGLCWCSDEVLWSRYVRLGGVPVGE